MDRWVGGGDCFWISAMSRSLGDLRVICTMENTGGIVVEDGRHSAF